MRATPPALAFALLLFGCRDFQLDSPASWPASHRCEAGWECESGVCTGGICCERTCAADELCTLPGYQGYCTPRPPGTACDEAEQCPGGHCLPAKSDGGHLGFCCEAECPPDSPCDLPGHEGRCTPRPPGTPCEAAAQCPGGHCLHTADAEGAPVAFCCEADCPADSACDLPGHEGRCRPRPLGAACQGAEECPSGFCVDGVCCESACAELCHTCSAGAVKGRCGLAPPNTDARKECGQCGACLRGLCGPADVGEDPNGLCGPGRVCGPGQNCGLPGNEACVADAECAVGACYLSRCLAVSSERVWAEPMAPVPYRVELRGLDVDSQGRLAFAVDELDDEGYGYAQYLHLPVRHATGAWTNAHPLPLAFQNWGTPLPDAAASLAFWNDRLYLALLQPAGGPEPTGLYGLLFSSTFQPAAPECFAPMDEDPQGLELSVDGQGRLVATSYSWDYAASLYSFHVQRREPQSGAPPAWTNLTPSGLASYTFDVAIVSGRPLVVSYPNANATLAVRWLDATAPADETPVPATCSVTDVFARTWREAAGEALLASLLCADAKTLIATWRPWLAPGERWTLAKLDLTLALGLAHADRPLLAALAETADPAAYDAVIAWIGSDGTWTSKAVATTRPGVHVQSVSGLLDHEGHPALVVGTAPDEYREDQNRLDLVRLRP